MTVEWNGEGEAPTPTDEPPADAPAQPVAPKLPWRARLQNRIRMAVLRWFGLDVVLSHQRHDLEALAQAAQKNARFLEQVALHTNAHAELMKAWRDGYPILGKIAAELRARKAKAAGKVLANGQSMTLVKADGTSPLTAEEVAPAAGDSELSRHGKLGAEVARNVARAMEGKEMLHTYDPQPAKGLGVDVKYFMGEKLTDDEIAYAKSEQARLIAEYRTNAKAN